MFWEILCFFGGAVVVASKAYVWRKKVHEWSPSILCHSF